MLLSLVKKKKEKKEEFRSGRTEILQCGADTGSLLKDPTLMACAVFDMRSASEGLGPGAHSWHRPSWRMLEANSLRAGILKEPGVCPTLA